MRERSEAFGCKVSGQRMIRTDNAYEAVMKERLQADLRPHRTDDADIGVDPGFTQGFDILLVLMSKA